jgi:CHASE3 domain sensor protein
VQRHAVALLMRMTNKLKARAELQSYARSLLRELEQMYAADEQTEKSGDDLKARLKGNLDYARSIFESRVALEGSDAAALLDDEISALIDTAQGTPFAQHLAVVAGLPVTSRNAAEAS